MILMVEGRDRLILGPAWQLSLIWEFQLSKRQHAKTTKPNQTTWGRRGGSWFEVLSVLAEDLVLVPRLPRPPVIPVPGDFQPLPTCVWGVRVGFSVCVQLSGCSRSCDYPGICSSDQVGLKLTEINLLLPLECWIQRSVPPPTAVDCSLQKPELLKQQAFLFNGRGHILVACFLSRRLWMKVLIPHT